MARRAPRAAFSAHRRSAACVSAPGMTRWRARPAHCGAPSGTRLSQHGCSWCQLCGASSVVQHMWCKLDSASYLVEATWASLCGAIYVVCAMCCM
eukprot:6105132-Pyramimonas_sp.AAC.1